MSTAETGGELSCTSMNLCDTLLLKLWLHLLEVIVDEVHHGFIYETLNNFTTDEQAVDGNEQLRYV